MESASNYLQCDVHIDHVSCTSKITKTLFLICQKGSKRVKTYCIRNHKSGHKSLHNHIRLIFHGLIVPVFNYLPFDVHIDSVLCTSKIAKNHRFCQNASNFGGPGQAQGIIFFKWNFERSFRAYKGTLLSPGRLTFPKKCIFEPP